MNKSMGISFIENWLSENEHIEVAVTNILWDFASPSLSLTGQQDHPTPQGLGSVVLTNKRLILIQEALVVNRNTPYTVPKWYSSTGIVGLAERPPRFNQNFRAGFRGSGNYPYQAELTLESGAKIILETDREQDEKGMELSRLLTKALFNLPSESKTLLFMKQYLEQKQEDERRRRND